MSDYYYDDPIEYEPSSRRKVPGILASILILLASGLFLNTTLAGNIRINSGVAVAFGQSVAATTACSGANILTIKPISDFANASGAGAFALKSVTVSGIPTTCYGKDFNISFFDNQNATSALPIFNSTVSVATVWDNAGTFEEGYQGTGTSVTSGSGTFTITFNTPLALSTDVAKVALQSSEHRRWTCQDGKLSCAVGDIGPGGGTVFYVSAGFSVEGSLCGNSCHYLEWAPNSWYGGTSDPQISYLTSDTSHLALPNPVASGGDLTLGSGALGQGFINTQRFMTSNGTTGYVAATSGAVYQVSRYSATDNSAGQWFLPSVQELVLMRASSVFSSGGFLTLPLPDTANPLYWSSTERDSGVGYYVFLLNSNPARNAIEKYGDSHMYVRPIRAF